MSWLRPSLGRLPALHHQVMCRRTFLEFSSQDRKGGYTQEPTKTQRQAMRREFFQIFPGELKRLKIHLKERWYQHFRAKRGSYMVFEDFSRTPDYVRPEWVVTADTDHKEGFSTASLERTPRGIAVFSGTLCTTVVQHGEQKRSGYVSMRSPMNMVFGIDVGWQFHDHNCVIVEYRGDGRNYTINIQKPGFFDVEQHDVHSYNLYTKGGPYWQTAKIPLSKFIFNYKGRIQDTQDRPDNKFTHMNISLIDHRPGPFRLELKRIGFYKDETLNENNAYEMYVASSTSKLYK